MVTRADGLPFDLWSLEIFLAVCDTGSMAAASRQLQLTQPAVSQMIADIEARTGTMLFDRAVRPLGLTPAGGLLRQRASGLLAEARQIAPLLRETERNHFPLIRVGLVDSMSRALSASLGQKLSEVTDHVSILSGLTASHASALLTRRLDVLIGVDDLDDIDGLERWPILSEPYILLAPDHLPQPRDPADLVTLAQMSELVRFSARSHTGVEIDRHLRRLRIDLPRRMEFDTPFGVTARVAARRGFAITTPMCIFEAAMPLDGLVCWPLPGPSIGRKLTLIARKQELGRVPGEVALFCRQSLREGALAALAKAVPWLATLVAIEEVHGAFEKRFVD